MELTSYSYDEIKDAYPDIFKGVFGYFDILSVPGFVILVGYKGQYIGFLSCYLHDAATVYIQHCGAVRKDGLTVTLFKKIVAELHKTYPAILGRIHNENIRALMVASFAGFKVIGARQATDGKLYLEILKVREDA